MPRIVYNPDEWEFVYQIYAYSGDMYRPGMRIVNIDILCDTEGRFYILPSLTNE